MQITGDNRAPERKDGFDKARHERPLEAVGCSALLGTGVSNLYAWISRNLMPLLR